MINQIKPATFETSEKIITDPMPAKRQRVKDKAPNVNARPQPSPEEEQEHVIIRNGVELHLSNVDHDPNVTIARDLHQRFPGHLVLIQAGEFLHAYNKCAYFLHRLKNYRMKLMGSGSGAYLRVGFPLKNSKRRIWKIMSDFQIPYLVVLGAKAAGYKTYTSEQSFEQQSLLLEIGSDVVARTIEELRQTDRLQHAASAKLLLKRDVTFRLKTVAQDLYQRLIRDVADYPRNHRHGLGKDMHVAASDLLRLVFDYAAAVDRQLILRQLSSLNDRTKFLITQAFELKLLSDSELNLRVALAVELGNLTGGLLAKLATLDRAKGNQ